MGKIRWACPECDEERHFKGLCRECTEYDDEGTPIKPVNRVRLNHTPTEHHHQSKPTKEDFVNQRRPHPSKKQLDRIKDAFNATSHVCGPDCTHDHEADFQSVGEALADARENIGPRPTFGEEE